MYDTIATRIRGKHVCIHACISVYLFISIFIDLEYETRIFANKLEASTVLYGVCEEAGALIHQNSRALITRTPIKWTPNLRKQPNRS